MKRVCCLLLFAAAVFAGDKAIVSFRLKAEPHTPLRGWMLERTEEGFRFERFGGGRRFFVEWNQVVAEDAATLRRTLKPEPGEDEKGGIIEGHELFFEGGGSQRGVLLGVNENGTHRLRQAGLTLPYPQDRIARVERVRIEETEAYSPEEIYARRLERTPPRTARGHRLLADYLYEIGSFDAATIQYRSAIAKNPLLRTELEPRLAELRSYQRDREASLVFRKAMKKARLDGRWRQAIADIETYIAMHPDAKRQGLRLVDKLRQSWLKKKTATFHRVKNQEFDRAIRRYLARLKPDFETARAWVTSKLPEELRQRVERRLSLEKGDYEMLAEAERSSRSAPHWATYWSGSFVINKRVKLGESTRKVIRGDPDRWWGHYDLVNVRSSWLKAYAAERLSELFEVVSVRTTDCKACAGRGQVKHMSFMPVKDVGNEWWEICRRCYGAKQDRAVVYR